MYVCRSDKNKKQIYFNYQQTICDKNWRADVSQHPDSTLCSRDRTSATSSPLTSCMKTCSVITARRRPEKQEEAPSCLPWQLCI